MAAVASAAHAHMNGTSSPSAAEDEELYSQLLRIQDAVLAGTHPQFTLTATAIAQLQAALIAPENHAAHAANHASSITASANSQVVPSTHAGLDPIFLQKSEHLVRAERAIKRQRLEHDVQAQGEQRKHFRFGKDADADLLTPVAVDEVLKAALERVKPVSGLKPEQAASVSSFDENDYYSSRAPSPWSDDAHEPSSDRAADAFTADFKRLANAGPSAKRTRSHDPRKGTQVYDGEDDDLYEPEDDEDDEYVPPGPALVAASRQGGPDAGYAQPLLDEDDNSDYEPGEITQDSAVPTPNQLLPHAFHPSPRVPVIRNHLTHIAAPQPNRVSPLATAKGPSIELELVNGRPELVKARPQYRSIPQQSRASTASPVNGVAGSGRKKRNKKRKRDFEPLKNTKKRRDRHVAHSPVSPAHREPYIKDEPVSPPPFSSLPDVPQYQQQPEYRPASAHVDLLSPAQPLRPQYITEQPRSGLRYEYAQPASPALVRVASPSTYRPVQRDTQDLRRVASMHYAQRAPSPTQRIYSPVGPYRAASAAYPSAQHAPHSEPVEQPRYAEVQGDPRVQYVRAPSPPRIQEYRDTYSRAASPAIMVPPPPPQARRIVVDQYGNRYYAAEPAPAPSPASLATEPQPMYERAPSRMSVAYAPDLAPRHEPYDPRMAPPPTPQRAEVEYVDANGYRLAEYRPQQSEHVRYSTVAPTSPTYQDAPRYSMAPPAPPAAEERTSPVYQQVPRYEPMPPPQAPPQRVEATSPVYQQIQRAYSVRPEAMHAPSAPPSGYIRQASVAPVQYRSYEMAPPPIPQVTRAVSVAPVEYGGQPQQPMYGYAPQPQVQQVQQAVRYVDQYGREVDMQALRQGSVARY
ncbi:hypothetical protein LTR86_008871 [Recurvomyces mirabilis]|nr:hypothetical protein LTR86_008871 [Recurvomyces mirabilis]